GDDQAVTRSDLRQGLTGRHAMSDGLPLNETPPAENPPEQLASHAEAAAIAASVSAGDGLGCHAGKAELKKAAEAAGKSETMARYAADYPVGPHDQPQSMCPALGSLRVGFRNGRTANVLSGSALFGFRP